VRSRMTPAAHRPGTESAGSFHALAADLIDRTVTARGLPIHPADPVLVAKIAALYRLAPTKKGPARNRSQGDHLDSENTGLRASCYRTQTRASRPVRGLRRPYPLSAPREARPV
jgi:hypothetical protein